MEVLYKKLYDKYSNLKVKKISQLDNVTNELEKRFTEYLTAADSYIDQLKGDNDKLRDDIDALKNEVASLRSSKYQSEDNQKLLIEERKKNEELTKEIDNLLKLQQEDTHVRKRRRLSTEASDTALTELVPSDIHQAEVPESSLSLSKENVYNIEQQQVICQVQPQCCSSSRDSGSCDCLFQVLVECFIGMKVSVVRQPNSVGISAVHQSSGYTFELTWLKKDATDETQFLYQVKSLGTFERVAPEWMREAIIFSMSMCPMFFERVSRVIKHV